MKNFIMILLAITLVAIPFTTMAETAVRLNQGAATNPTATVEGDTTVVTFKLTNNSGYDHGKVKVIVSINKNEQGCPVVVDATQVLDEFKNGTTYDISVKLKGWGAPGTHPHLEVVTVN